MGAIDSGVYHSKTRLQNEGVPPEDLSSSQARGGGEKRGSRLDVRLSNDELEPGLEWDSVDSDEASEQFGRRSLTPGPPRQCASERPPALAQAPAPPRPQHGGRAPTDDVFP